MVLLIKFDILYTVNKNPFAMPFEGKYSFAILDIKRQGVPKFGAIKTNSLFTQGKPTCREMHILFSSSIMRMINHVLRKHTTDILR